MKVLFVTNKLTIGGKERQIVELLRFFDSGAGYSFAVCLREKHADYDFSGTGIKVFKPARRLGFFALMRFQRRVLKEFQPDIVHTWEAVCALAITLNVIVSPAKIHLLDGTLQYAKSFPWYKKAYLIPRFTRRMAAKVVANSNAGLNAIHYGFSPKYIVIPNGLDFERFHLPESGNKPNPEEVIIGMVAGFTAPKDFASLIVAGKRLLGSGYKLKFMLLGDGPEKPDLEAMIPPELKDKFIFTGFVHNPESYIKQFDIGVLLSKRGHSEGLSNSILEYMALAKPVICTKTGGNIELVESNQTGFMVDFEDVDELTEKLTLLIEDGSLRERFGRHARRNAMANFAMENIGARFINLYQSLYSS